LSGRPSAHFFPPARRDQDVNVLGAKERTRYFLADRRSYAAPSRSKDPCSRSARNANQRRSRRWFFWRIAGPDPQAVPGRDPLPSGDRRPPATDFLKTPQEFARRGRGVRSEAVPFRLTPPTPARRFRKPDTFSGEWGLGSDGEEKRREFRGRTHAATAAVYVPAVRRSEAPIPWLPEIPISAMRTRRGNPWFPRLKAPTIRPAPAADPAGGLGCSSIGWDPNRQPAKSGPRLPRGCPDRLPAAPVPAAVGEKPCISTAKRIGAERFELSTSWSQTSVRGCLTVADRPPLPVVFR